MTKRFEAWGKADGDYQTPEEAAEMTYLTGDGRLVPTPFDHPDNPFRNELKDVKNVLEIGCGIGRNLPFFIANTDATYYGVDPNPSMIRHFWDVQDPKWKDRTYVTTSFDQIIQTTKFDMVVSTFVLQHFTQRPPPDVMDSSDVTREIMKYTVDGCLWFMLEHMHEDDGWLFRWMEEFGIDPDVYIDSWSPESMNHRGSHNLLIFKEKKDGINHSSSNGLTIGPVAGDLS